MQYSFSNKTRDLIDILDTVRRDEPRFISNFNRVPGVVGGTLKFTDDIIQVKGFTALNNGGGLFTVSKCAVNDIHEGMLIRPMDSAALFRIAKKDYQDIYLDLVASNGTDISGAAGLDDGVIEFSIISYPEGAFTDGDEVAPEPNWNAYQQFSKDIVASDSILALNTYGSIDNVINRQTAFALSELARDLNRVALFGRRAEAAAPDIRAEAGGLYWFASVYGCGVINGHNEALTSELINRAASVLIRRGGDPMQILCPPGQARVISNEYRDRIQILRSDDRRGAYVAVIVNEINGRGMTIMADPDVPDTDVWILDTAGFKYSVSDDTGFKDRDNTPNGFNGVRRVASGAITFEFNNIAQRCVRIYNVQRSFDTVTAMSKRRLERG